jgi:hypothetical protein
MQARPAVDEQAGKRAPWTIQYIDKNRNGSASSLGSFGRRVACAAGCVGSSQPAGKRASERVRLGGLDGINVVL